MLRRIHHRRVQSFVIKHSSTSDLKTPDPPFPLYQNHSARSYHHSISACSSYLSAQTDQWTSLLPWHSSRSVKLAPAIVHPQLTNVDSPPGKLALAIALVRSNLEPRRLNFLSLSNSSEQICHWKNKVSLSLSLSCARVSVYFVDKFTTTTENT